MKQYADTAGKIVSAAWELRWHFCLSVKKAIYACNLGDSRIYRHFQGKLQQISTDHVISGKMLGKAPLTQYLGFQEENMALEPSIVEIGYQTGSSYLICSDGVTDMLSDEEIQEILSKTGTAEEKVEELLEMALSRGGRDNVTMILAQINGYEEKSSQTMGRTAQHRAVETLPVIKSGIASNRLSLPVRNIRDKENLR